MRQEILFATCKLPGSQSLPRFQFAAYVPGKSAAISNSEVPIFGAAAGAVFNEATAEVMILSDNGILTVIDTNKSFAEVSDLNATPFAAMSLVLDQRTGRVFYTGEQLLRPGLTKLSVYSLGTKPAGEIE